VKDSQGQMIITAGQVVWTHECEKALADADSARRAVKALKKKWIRCVGGQGAVRAGLFWARGLPWQGFGCVRPDALCSSTCCSLQSGRT